MVGTNRQGNTCGQCVRLQRPCGQCRGSKTKITVRDWNEVGGPAALANAQQTAMAIADHGDAVHIPAPDDLSEYIPDPNPDFCSHAYDRDKRYAKPVSHLSEAIEFALTANTRTEYDYQHDPITGDFVRTEHEVPSGAAWKELVEPQQFSGHKLHVAASTPEETAAAIERLLPVAEQYGLGMKAAAPHVLEKTGKGVTIYLTRRSTLDRDAAVIADALEDYNTDQKLNGTGATQLGNGLWHRYEFKRDPGYDVGYGEYHNLYRPETY